MAHMHTLDSIRSALALDDFDHVSAWMRMAPRIRQMKRASDKKGQPRQAGILLLLYPHEDSLTFVLTRRTDTVANHKGQVSLPGGAKEPADASLQDAARREICEELSICLDTLDILGPLTPLYVSVSDFLIHPFVGYIDHRPDFIPQPDEVAEVIEISLPHFLDDHIKTTEEWNLHGTPVDVPFYQINGHAVWGATAIILSEFEARLKAITP